MSTIGPNDSASLVNTIPISMLAQHHLDMARSLAQSAGSATTPSTPVMALHPVIPTPTTIQEERMYPWPDTDDEKIYVSMLADAGVNDVNNDYADYLMIDIGAGITTCPKEFAEAGPQGSSSWIEPKELPPLEAATGQSIIHQGACEISFMASAIDQQQETFKMRFQVTNVKCAIVAQQDLLETGFVPRFGAYASVLEAPSGRIFPLVQHGRIWYMKVKRVVLASEVALTIAPLRQPAAAQPIPLYRDGQRQGPADDEVEGASAGGAASSSAAAAAAVPGDDQPRDHLEIVRKQRDAIELCDSPESRVAKAKGVPVMPPLPERQLHRLTHWPYRSWCKACVVWRWT